MTSGVCKSENRQEDSLEYEAGKSWESGSSSGDFSQMRGYRYPKSLWIHVNSMMAIMAINSSSSPHDRRHKPNAGLTECRVGCERLL